MAFASVVRSPDDEFAGVDWADRRANLVRVVVVPGQQIVRLVSFQGQETPPLVLHLSRREARLVATWLSRGAAVADANRGLGADDPDTPGQVIGKLDGPAGGMLLGYTAPSAAHGNVMGVWDVGLELAAPPGKQGVIVEFPADQARHMADLLAQAVQWLEDHAPRELTL